MTYAAVELKKQIGSNIQNIYVILKAYAQAYYVQSFVLQNCIQTNYKIMSFSALSNEFDNIDCKTVACTGHIIEGSKLLALLSEKEPVFA